MHFRRTHKRFCCNRAVKSITIFLKKVQFEYFICKILNQILQKERIFDTELRQQILKSEICMYKSIL